MKMAEIVQFFKSKRIPCLEEVEALLIKFSEFAKTSIYRNY